MNQRGFVIPALYLYAGLFLAGVAAGSYGVHTWYKAQSVKAIEAARKTERGLQRGANQADVRYVDALDAQRETAALNERKFRRTLDEKNRELANCRVDAAVVGLLDDAGTMPEPAGSPAEPRPPAAGAAPAPDSTCDVELDKCRANYAEVCVPNAIQVRELQKFTRDLIRNYNRTVGRE